MPLSGGSSSSGVAHAHCAAVALAANTASGGGTIPFDTIDFDTDGYFNVGTHLFTIPAGLSGAYLVNLVLDIQDDAALTSLVAQLGFAAEPVLFSPVSISPRIAAAASEGTCVTAVGRFSASDTLGGTVSFTGPATVTINTLSTMSVTFLGTLP